MWLSGTPYPTAGSPPVCFCTDTLVIHRNPSTVSTTQLHAPFHSSTEIILVKPRLDDTFKVTTGLLSVVNFIWKHLSFNFCHHPHNRGTHKCAALQANNSSGDQAWLNIQFPLCPNLQRQEPQALHPVEYHKDMSNSEIPSD